MYKVLGQTNPSATTLTDSYTCANANGAVVSSILIANRGAATTFRISVAPAGAADSNEQYIAYDVPISANDVVDFTCGITLEDTDVIRVYAGAARLSFNIFGEEVP